MGRHKESFCFSPYVGATGITLSGLLRPTTHRMAEFLLLSAMTVVLCFQILSKLVGIPSFALSQCQGQSLSQEPESVHILHFSDVPP